MSRFLFPRLTPRPQRGAALFNALVNEARQPHWFLSGKVPDTLDGRFAVLATVTALATVRLEQGGDEAREAAVALTERFVDAMDSEHREMGIGDPSIGKTVRKLVGSLGRRVELWREALRGQRMLGRSRGREPVPRLSAIPCRCRSLRAAFAPVLG